MGEVDDLLMTLMNMHDSYTRAVIVIWVSIYSVCPAQENVAVLCRERSGHHCEMS
jgi:hypothetical protein